MCPMLHHHTQSRQLFERSTAFEYGIITIPLYEKVRKFKHHACRFLDKSSYRLDADVHDLRSIETEFPAIVFNDTLTSEATISYEPKVSSLNNDEIDFIISFDKSDDEDYMRFENEFLAIVYNDAPMSKSYFLAEPTLYTQHIDEFDLKEETSLSEYDEEEQNVLNFNNLFPFNVIYPNDSKSDKDNDDDKVDIEHSSRDLSFKPLPDVINTDVGAYAHSTVYTAYSLNEYSVYDTCINTAYLGELIRRIDFLYSLDYYFESNKTNTPEIELHLLFIYFIQDLVKEISTSIGGEFSNLEDLEVLES
ncbi:hypothetical protein Tco_0121685 [Tanacetum coccineum]